jgi:hypothetical protein
MGDAETNSDEQASPVARGLGHDSAHTCSAEARLQFVPFSTSLVFFTSKMCTIQSAYKRLFVDNS